MTMIVCAISLQAQNTGRNESIKQRVKEKVGLMNDYILLLVR